jgi:hypothetical protein
LEHKNESIFAGTMIRCMAICSKWIHASNSPPIDNVGKNINEYNSNAINVILSVLMGSTFVKVIIVILQRKFGTISRMFMKDMLTSKGPRLRLTKDNLNI